MSPYVIAGAELAPDAIERIVRAISESRYDASPDPERFSIREIVAHLADWEPVLRDRMVLALGQPGVTVQFFDEGERAIQNRYSESDIWEQMGIWRAERTKTVTFLRSLEPSQFEVPLIHPVTGPMTVGDVACSMSGHDLYHIEQLSAYLAG